LAHRSNRINHQPNLNHNTKNPTFVGIVVRNGSLATGVSNTKLSISWQLKSK
jgi:hypothetical protein